VCGSEAAGVPEAKSESFKYPRPKSPRTLPRSHRIPHSRAPATLVAAESREGRSNPLVEAESVEVLALQPPQAATRRRRPTARKHGTEALPGNPPNYVADLQCRRWQCQSAPPFPSLPDSAKASGSRSGSCQEGHGERVCVRRVCSQGRYSIRQYEEEIRQQAAPGPSCPFSAKLDGVGVA
jgi:hypothetical protein